MRKRVNVLLELLKSWGWLIFSAVVIVVFSAGQLTGTSGEKMTQLEAFRTEQRGVNTDTTKKLNEIDRNVVVIGQRLDDFLSRRAAATTK